MTHVYLRLGELPSIKHGLGDLNPPCRMVMLNDIFIVVNQVRGASSCWGVCEMQRCQWSWLGAEEFVGFVTTTSTAATTICREELILTVWYLSLPIVGGWSGWVLARRTFVFCWWHLGQVTDESFTTVKNTVRYPKGWRARRRRAVLCWSRWRKDSNHPLYSALKGSHPTREDGRLQTSLL